MCVRIFREKGKCDWCSQQAKWGMEQPGRCQLAAPAIPPVSSATLAARCLAQW